MARRTPGSVRRRRERARDGRELGEDGRHRRRRERARGGREAAEADGGGEGRGGREAEEADGRREELGMDASSGRTGGRGGGRSELGEDGAKRCFNSEMNTEVLGSEFAKG